MRAESGFRRLGSVWVVSYQSTQKRPPATTNITHHAYLLHAFSEIRFTHTHKEVRLLREDEADRVSMKILLLSLASSVKLSMEDATHAHRWCTLHVGIHRRDPALLQLCLLAHLAATEQGTCYRLRFVVALLI